uniref:Nonstructural protein n=1 Tax=Parvoviridae sp. TaxID=1940570 RepID=A0A7D3QIZ6_9VIRU|nr:MAG: nonstructural protein [Parvoviridae sp.]
MQDEMESTGSSYRIFLWVGSSGTSGDLTVDQASAVLVEETFVMMPLPTLDKQLKKCNMKEWQCGIIQLCEYTGEPLCAPLPYALFFNNLTTVSDWIATGEYNKDGIFHCHAMFRTGVRSDSLRRSMLTVWNNLMGTTGIRELLYNKSGTMDCLKLQRCHKPESMMGYMMKNPMWVIGTKYDLLDILHSIDGWGLNERFKPKESDEVITESGSMNRMTEELIELITEYGCKTFEDCLRCGPHVMQKYLHRPGLNTIVNNCLQFVKTTGNAWNISVYEKYTPNPCKVHRVLLFQGIQPTQFDQIFFTWITKADTKRNTICIQGPSNTGKSAFISGLKQCLNWGEIVNAPTFAFEGLVDSNIGIWEEPLISAELAEKTKQVFEGMTTSIPIKHKRPQMLPRTPILITTNHNLWRFCNHEEEMFKNRCWIFHFNFTPKDSVMICRTSEPSCQCCNCRTSGRGAAAHGEPSAGGMSREEQSMVGTVRTQPTGTMGSGPVHGGDAGVSECYGGAPSSSVSSTDIECPGTSKSSGTAGSTAQQHMGSFRIIRRGDNEREHSTVRKRVESIERRGNDGNDGSSVRNRGHPRMDVRRDRRRARDSESEYDSGGDVVMPSPNPQKKAKVKSYPQGPELDRFLGTVDEVFDTTMSFPNKQDWTGYLSYLFHRYG